MSALAHTTSYDFETGLFRLAFHGTLDVASASTMRSTVFKALAEYPQAIIVDLDDLQVLQKLALLVLPALVHNRDDIPILLYCDPRSDTGRVARAMLRTEMLVYDNERDALDALAQRSFSSKRAHLHLRPEPGAAVVARRLVVGFCRTWGLQDLRPVAELITSELVTNAIQHACTDIEVTAALGRHSLHLHVRDRTRRLPALSSADGRQPHHNRGLQLVDRLSHGWGTTLAPYGKTVWATLKLRPLREPAP